MTVLLMCRRVRSDDLPPAAIVDSTPGRLSCYTIVPVSCYSDNDVHNFTIALSVQSAAVRRTVKLYGEITLTVMYKTHFQNFKFESTVRTTLGSLLYTALCVSVSQLVNVHLKLDGTVSRLDPQAKPHNNLYYIATGIKITMHALYVHMYYI